MAVNKNKQISQKIALSIAKWDKERVVSDYMREKLSEINEESKKTHFDDLVDNVIKKAQAELEPQWTPLLLSMIRVDEKKLEPATINFFQVAANEINDSVGRLVNVTPKNDKKRGIQSII